MAFKKKYSNRHKYHRVYRNSKGVPIPGVSTIKGEWSFGNEGLSRWRDGMFRSGYDPDSIAREAAAVGTLVHKMVELTLRGETIPDTLFEDYTANEIKQAEIAYESFLLWKKTHVYKVLNSEISLVSELYQYGGTVDLLIEVPSPKIVLLDWKSSGGLYSSQVIQAAAYAQLVEENKQMLDIKRVDEIWIVRLGKKIAEIQEKVIKKWDNAFKAFKLCRELYSLRPCIE